MVKKVLDRFQNVVFNRYPNRGNKSLLKKTKPSAGQCRLRAEVGNRSPHGRWGLSPVSHPFCSEIKGGGQMGSAEKVSIIVGGSFFFFFFFLGGGRSGNKCNYFHRSRLMVIQHLFTNLYSTNNVAIMKVPLGVKNVIGAADIKLAENN